jgi:hypothetical protein
MEQRARPRVLTFKGLNAQEIEMELTSVYGDEAFQISAVKKSRTHFLQGGQSSEMTHDREGLPILI